MPKPNHYTIKEKEDMQCLGMISDREAYLIPKSINLKSFGHLPLKALCHVENE